MLFIVLCIATIIETIRFELRIPMKTMINLNSTLFSLLIPDHTIDFELQIYRLTITASCPMNLEYFPMDRQLCQIEIESCKYPFSQFHI